MDFELFTKRVYSITGIDIEYYKERQMKRRIDSLIKRHKYSSYEEYLFYMEKNPSLLKEFTNYLTINVSEFFRNPEQWQVLKKEILPVLINERGNNIKVWCCASAAGEEPYSLAILFSLLKEDKEYKDVDFKVIASDIDERCLEKCKDGIYDEKTLSNVPLHIRMRCFREKEGKFIISKDIKDMVEFRKIDIIHGDYVKECDLILCRNVVIYLNSEGRDIVYNKLSKSLNKNGVLFIGSTEQIVEYKKMGYSHLKPFFYKKV